MANDHYHIPVLLHDAIDGLITDVNGTYVDVTFGGGGHSAEILNRLGDNGVLVGFDQDKDAEANIPDDKRFHFVRHNFAYLRNHLRMLRHTPVDGVLADLGVSSHHFDAAHRGFSFRFDAKLDMRMNQDVELTAAKVLNTYEEESLVRLFSQYGEIKNSRKAARLVVAARNQKRLVFIRDLKDAIGDALPKGRENQYVAKLFQALRIEVNDEMQVLADLLKQCVEVLKPGGKLIVITYHSLEDRMVKNFIRSGNLDGKLEKDFYGNVLKPFDAINRKVIIPTDEEIERNSRARSAKMRMAVKL